MTWAKEENPLGSQQDLTQCGDWRESINVMNTKYKYEWSLQYIIESKFETTVRELVRNELYGRNS